MSHHHCILAHDLGTTGNKATLFDASTGSTLASTFHPYHTRYPHPGWAEQDPADWQAAVFASTRYLLDQSSLSASKIAAISFSGQMQAALLLDAQGQPLRPAMIWADQRASSQADRIAQLCGRDAVYRLTGSQVNPAYTAAKLLWIKDHETHVYDRGHKILQPKDYAVFLLTGQLVTDYSDASGTQLFDLKNRRWAVDLVDSIGLRPDLLPEAHPSTAVVGTVSAGAAASTGLLAGTPVVIGGGDGACATVGAGVVQEGDAYTYIGSSGWIGLSTKQPIVDPQQRTFTFAHLDPDLYFPVGSIQAAGGAYSWLEGVWRTDEDTPPMYKEMDAQAAAVAPGAGGVLFLPHLLGERSPYWNPKARGAFVGLAMPHGRAEMARAVLEGVAFNLRLTLDAMREQGVHPTAMRLIGGGACSPVWRQILSDTFQLPILLPELTAEATALGAAVAGGVGVGLFPDFTVVHQLIPTRESERPDHELSQRYDQFYALFRDSYSALEPIFERLSELSEGLES